MGRLGDPEVAAVEEPRVFLTENECEVRRRVELDACACLRE
jgi:hypothetical protein